MCFSGCSITWGDELHDRLNERFSTLVSNHYGCQHLNIGQCGVSNDFIVRNTIKYLQSNKPDIVVMQYTVHSRLEYFINQTTEKWTPQRANSTKRSRAYYLSVHNEIFAAENMWKNIFLFESYCKSVGQKYVSLMADHFERVIIKPERFYNGYYGNWRSMCKDRQPSFIQSELLGMDKINPQNYAQGFGGGHPSAEGHKVIANKIIELIDAI